MRFDLPQEFKYKELNLELGAVTDPEPCNDAWSTIAEAVKRLYENCTSLEMAINRQTYMRMSSVGMLGRRLNVVEAELHRVQNRETLLPLYDIDWNPSLYKHPPADVTSGFIRLPIESEQYYTPSRIDVSFPNALEYDSGNHFDMISGSWSAVVKSSKPLHRPQGFPGTLKEGASCLIEITLPRPQPVNYLSFRPACFPSVDIISISLEDDSGNIYKLCAPEDAPVKSFSLKDYKDLLFPIVTAVKLHITLYQRHRQRVELPAESPWYEYHFGLANLKIGTQNRGHKTQWVSLPLSIPKETQSIYLDVKTEPFPDGNTVEFDIVVENETSHPILPITVGNTITEFVAPIPGAIEGWQGVLRMPAISEIELYEGNKLLSPNIDYTIKDRQLIILNHNPLEEIKAVYSPDRNYLKVKIRDLCQEYTEEFNGTDKDGVITLARPLFVDKELIATLPDDWDQSLIGGVYTPVEVTIYTPDGRILTQPTEPEGEGIRNLTPYRAISRFNVPDEAITYTTADNKIKMNVPLEENSQILVRYKALPEDVRLSVNLKCSISNDTQTGAQVSDIYLRYI